MAGRSKIYKHGIPVWSPSRLESLIECERKFYFRYKCSEKFPMTPQQARGKFLHSAFEARNLFKEDNSPRYKSAESFANQMAARWKRYVARQASIGGNTIEWGDTNLYEIAEIEIKPICKALYPVFIEEGPPLLYEFGFEFIFEGRAYTGIIDAILRDGEMWIIRDLKSGRKPSESMIAKSLQITFYSLAFSVCANADKRFRSLIGMDDETASSLAGNPVYIPDKSILMSEFLWLTDEIGRERTALWAANHFSEQLKKYGLDDDADVVLGIKERFKKRISGEAITLDSILLRTSRCNEDYNLLIGEIGKATRREIELNETGDYLANREFCSSCEYKKPCSEWERWMPKQNSKRLFYSFDVLHRPGKKISFCNCFFKERKNKALQTAQGDFWRGKFEYEFFIEGDVSKRDVSKIIVYANNIEDAKKVALKIANKKEHAKASSGKIKRKGRGNWKWHKVF